MQPALAPAPHPSMQTSAQDHADQVLHDQLLAAQHHLQGGRPAPGPQQHLQPNTASPRDQTNIDPAISGVLGGPPQTPPPPQHQHSSPEDNTPKSYGKRELSTSKRAAQNRAAQRAFRQRKENYIRKLEEEVKTLDSLREKANSLAGENYQLREYVINLQSRLLEAQGEVPELPPNIDLTQARENYLGGVSASATAPPQGQHLGAAPNDDMNSLNRIAVAGLGMRKHPDETGFMGNNFQPNKRLRGDDNQGDGEVKNETHGLPMA